MIESKTNDMEHPEVVAQRISHYARLPEGIKVGFDTGTGAAPLRTPAGHPITHIAEKPAVHRSFSGKE
jgi:hypothetical protein